VRQWRPITHHQAFFRGLLEGGDARSRGQTLQTHNIEKIIAWGGLAGIRHVTKYIQPGLELISLDPKTSISVVGPKALDDEQQMRETARRLAIDIGGANQAGCASSRVTFVVAARARMPSNA